ncbi:MAG TPA: hypothetical protein PKA53_04405 [Sphingobacterium sp.]|nr:hypothetical protein [Sphingobacterium sp.]
MRKLFQSSELWKSSVITTLSLVFSVAVSTDLAIIENLSLNPWCNSLDRTRKGFQVLFAVGHKTKQQEESPLSRASVVPRSCGWITCADMQSTRPLSRNPISKVLRQRVPDNSQPYGNKNFIIEMMP